MKKITHLISELITKPKPSETEISTELKHKTQQLNEIRSVIEQSHEIPFTTINAIKYILRKPPQSMNSNPSFKNPNTLK